MDFELLRVPKLQEWYEHWCANSREFRSVDRPRICLKVVLFTILQSGHESCSDQNCGRCENGDGPALIFNAEYFVVRCLCKLRRHLLLPNRPVCHHGDLCRTKKSSEIPLLQNQQQRICFAGLAGFQWFLEGFGWIHSVGVFFSELGRLLEPSDPLAPVTEMEVTSVNTAPPLCIFRGGIL